MSEIQIKKSGRGIAKKYAGLTDEQREEIRKAQIVAARRNYYLKHKERLVQLHKDYYEENKEYLFQKHYDYMKKRTKKYQQQNVE